MTDDCKCPDGWQGVHVSPTCPVMARQRGAIKETERIEIGALRGVAHYLPTRIKGSRVITGWTLRFDVPGTDYRIEGNGTTQGDALHFFTETAKQWLKDTNRKPVIT